MDNTERFVAELEKLLETEPNPDQPLLGIGDQSYTLRQIVEEIKGKTPMGQQLLTRWKELSDQAKG